MESIMQYLTAFGLATGAGGKAAIPLLALGVFHYTPYFELSERFAWIASPVVMTVLAVVMIAEIVADAHPEMGRFADVAAYLPKLAAGFIAFAAVTGEVDDSLQQLLGTGVLGGVTAGGATWLRNRMRRPVRDHAEELHDGIGRVAAIGESGLVASLSTAFILVPVIGAVGLALSAGGGWLFSRRLDDRRRSCPHCKQPVRHDALVCPHCRRDMVSGA
ncbi:MAG: DUF4126 family protein [Acidobacteria bacterium]|nr:DUF4126 family protein [Acidobacteriota bacterium]